MKKLLMILMVLTSLVIVQVPVFAQGTILPKAGDTVTSEGGKEGDIASCDSEITKFNETGNFENVLMDKSELLGCAIKSGRISLPMVPYFIQYFSNYALGLVSILALLFIVIGGFLYTLGGLTEQKDKGKNFIKNALIGMVIAFMAWTIVNVIISAITG